MPQLTDEDLREIYASNPVDEFTLVTLELIHSSFQAPGGGQDSIRIALDNQPWDLPIEADAPLFAGQTKTFLPLNVEVVQPAQEEGSLGEMEFAIDNVPMQYMNRIREGVKIRTPAILIYREYILNHNASTGVYSLASTMGPAHKIDGLAVKKLRATPMRLTATARFVDIVNVTAPRRIFSREECPSLFV